MATQVQIRRGTNTQNASFTGAEGELSANTTNSSVHVHDGSTAGGFELARADLNNVSDTDLNAALTGNTLASLTITSADINGGNIDGTTIGGSTPAAGTFTTFTSNGIDDNADAIAITIDSSEKVKIGSAAGSEKLSVAGSITTDGYIYPTTDNGWSLGLSGNRWGSVFAQTADFENSVSIGTSSADTALHIQAADSDTANSASNGHITFADDGGTSYYKLRMGTTNRYFALDGYDTDSAWKEIITFDRVDQNVGIGTNSPHSSGASFTVLNLNGTKGGSLAFSRGTNSATKQWAIRTSDDEDLRFEYGSTLASEAMRIDGSNGNVGIGTSSISHRLAVKSASATDPAIKIEQSGNTDGWGLIANGNEGTLDFSRIGGGVAGTHFTITNTGNVGIGTSVPNTGLSVVTGSANGIELGQDSDASTDSARLFFSTSAGSNAIHSSSGAMRFFTGSTAGSSTGTERMRLRSDGNFGLGSSGMPVYSGNVQLSLGPMAHFMAETSSGTDRSLHISQNAHFDGDGSWETMETDEATNYYQNAGTHGFRVASSTSAGTDITWNTALLIDNTGNLLVGTTDTTLFNNTSGGGIGLMAANRLDVARSGDVVATFNRTTNDGAIVQFYDRGTLSGQIGVESAAVFLGNPLNGGGLRIGGDITAPSNSIGTASNNTQDLGTSSFRWKTIYAVNALNTSDEKLKQDIEGLSDAEKRVAVALKGLVKKYRFKDEVAAQGSDAKIRVGLIAQQVVSAFDDEGLTATDYALLSHETDTDAQFNELETKTYSINYSELLAFIISAI